MARRGLPKALRIYKQCSDIAGVRPFTKPSRAQKAKIAACRRKKGG